MRYAERLHRIEQNLPPDPIERQRDWEKCVTERAQISTDIITVMKYMESIAPEETGFHIPAGPDTPTEDEFCQAELRLRFR